MKFLSKLLLAIIIVVAILIGALAIFIATFDANDYKQEIVDLVKKNTGRDLSINGDIKLAMYPDIALQVGKASLSNAAGFTDKSFANISEGKVSVKLLPLLKKQLKADQVFLQGLELNLERKADGSSNWDDLVKGNKTASPETTNTSKEPSKVVEEMMANLSIAGVNLKEAKIHWKDAQAKQDITLSPFNLSTGKFSPGSPLPIELELVMVQKNPAMTISAETTTVLNLSKDNKNFSLKDLKLHSNISTAQIGKSNVDINLSGDISGTPERISVAGLNLKSNLSGEIIPEGAVKTDITGNLDFDVASQLLNIAGMKIDSDISGKPLAGGTLLAKISGDTKLDLSKQLLSIPNLALDAKLAGGHVKNGVAGALIKGQTQFDLAQQILTIKSMTSKVNASGELLQGGKADTKINGDITLNLAKQLLSIPNLSLNANASGGYVKGGAANAKVNGNTQFNLGNQQLSFKGLNLVANANGELLKGGTANTKVTGDLQLDLARSQIKSPAISVVSNVEGGLVPGGKLTQSTQANLDLNWASKKGALNLSNLLVKLAGMEVKGSKVQVQPLAAKPSISGQFQTNNFNLKQVMKTLGITLAATKNPKMLSTLQARFTLKADTNKADLTGLNVKLDNTTMTGSLGVANFSNPATLPSLKPQLAIDSINLDDYLSPSPAPTSAAAKTAAQNTAASNELLPLDTLRKLNINGSVKIGKMVVNKLKLAAINAKINAKQGLVIIDPANASLYQGKYKGRITIDAKQAVPTMKMRHELAGMRSEGLLFDLFQDKYISGGTKLVTDLSSRGNSIDALLKNLNGTTSIAFNDGTIRDSSFAEKVSLAVKVFEKKELKDGKSVVKFTGLSGDWKTNNGVFKTDNLSLLSPFFNIKGSGTADVASQKLNMKLRIGPNQKKGERPLFAPLTITGTFSNPKFGLDLKDLIKAVAAQDVAKLKADAKKQLAAKEKQLKAKFEKEKAAQQQKLKQKAAKAKADAIKKLKAKTGDKLGNQILQKIGVDKKPKSKEKNPDGTPVEKKSVEDEVKDKLKNKLKNLF